VAREDDLAWLDAVRFDVRAVLEAVRITGDAGVGKTRLYREFLKVASSKGDSVIEVGPDPWWAEVSYYALRKAIVRLSRLPEGGGSLDDWIAATPEAKRGLAEIFDKTDGPPSSTKPAPPRTGSLSSEDRRFIAAEALRWALTRAHQLAQKGRVILAIDDVHAVDGASRNAFGDVIAEPPLAPILVIATHPPDFDPGWDGAWRELPGLPTDVAASLVRGGTPGAHSGSDETRTVPPLYIDQLVRFSMEGGSDPPSRMADLVALRIERLPQDARRTLQAIAVVGDATDKATLRRLLPDIPDFEELTKVLADAGFIEERAEPQEGAGAGAARLRAPRTLRTAHPLFREITLAAIPAAVRRHLHAKAAVDENGDPLPLPLEVQALHAYHAQSAFEALMMLEQVADRAAARDDKDGCVLALRRGLDLARRELFRGELDDPMRAVLIFCRKLGEALARAGNLSDADGLLREALDLAGPSGRDRALVLGSLAAVARDRARALLTMGPQAAPNPSALARANEATTYLKEALSLAKESAANDLVVSLERMRRDWAEQV
jgi:serine/threonine-protein kinase